MKNGIFQITHVHDAEGEKGGEGRQKRQTDRQTDRAGQRSLAPRGWGGRQKRQLTAGASSHSHEEQHLNEG